MFGNGSGGEIRDLVMRLRRLLLPIGKGDDMSIGSFQQPAKDSVGGVEPHVGYANGECFRRRRWRRRWRRRSRHRFTRGSHSSPCRGPGRRRRGSGGSGSRNSRGTASRGNGRRSLWRRTRHDNDSIPVIFKKSTKKLGPCGARVLFDNSTFDPVELFEQMILVDSHAVYPPMLSE
jgi:hypothetical protein